jgi:hypothetical protein
MASGRKFLSPRWEGGIRWSERPLIWKIKKGAALVAVVAMAIQSVFIDARQLQSPDVEKVDPCDILRAAKEQNKTSRCQTVRCSPYFTYPDNVSPYFLNLR